MELKELNTLLNKALGTLDEKYTNGKKELEKCNFNFVKSVEGDPIKLKVYSYFFPCKTALEKNEDCFWFLKYKEVKNYNEYEFSLDLLKLFIQYILDNNAEKFNSDLDDLIKEFGVYKNFDYFFQVIKEYLDHLLAIDAFFTKDNKFFSNNFGIIINNDVIQNKEFIYNLNEIISRKAENLSLKREIEKNKKIAETQNNIINLLKIKITNIEKNNNKRFVNLENELFESKQKLINKIEDLEKRLDQIDLRDTIKMTFKYVYNILYEHFKFVSYEENFWAQIKIIKETFKKEFNKKYDFISNFIDDLEFNKMNELNKQAHSSDGNRALKNIKTYLQNTSDTDLDQVINFFNKLPFLDDFININLKFYFNQGRAQDEFKKKYNVTYSEIYRNVFESN